MEKILKFNTKNSILVIGITNKKMMWVLFLFKEFIMQKFIDFINDLSTKSFILISVTVGCVFTIPFNFINMYLNRNPGGQEIFNSMSILGVFLLNVIIGPIIESYLIIFITKLIGKFTKNKIKITIITAMLFACAHGYSYEYILLSFIPSLTLVYSYDLYDNRNRKISSFLIMTIVHGLYNFMQLITSELIYYYLTR